MSDELGTCVCPRSSKKRRNAARTSALLLGTPRFPARVSLATLCDRFAGIICPRYYCLNFSKHILYRSSMPLRKHQFGLCLSLTIHVNCVLSSAAVFHSDWTHN